LITEELITEIANKLLKETDRFITRLQVLTGNRIEIWIDGDSPVKIVDCVELSRFIEGELNRDNEDFSLEVSSHGANAPLVMWRQYPKHIGRSFQLSLTDNSVVEGELAALTKEELELTYTVREKKTVGKGKLTVHKSIKVPFNRIKESRIKLKF